MKKPIKIYIKEFVKLFTNHIYYWLSTFTTHFTPPTQIPILLHLQQTLKFIFYFLKTNEEFNLKKQKITIWRLGKNNFY